MSDLKICRICLRTESKVYNYDQYQLKSYYEEVIALKVNERDNLPHYFCYECATTLHKFHKFKEKCYRGHRVLKEISWKGAITYESVYEVDRLQNKLTSSLEVLTVTKRVKTYTALECVDMTDSDNESLKLEGEKEDKVKNIEIAFVSEESMTDHDDHYEPETDPVEDERDNDEDDTPLHTIAQQKVIDDSPKIVEEKPTSPETVFVNVKKEIVRLKKEKIKERKQRKERRRSFSEYGLKKQNPKFSKKRTRNFDLTNWKKSTLSEEDAVKEFRARADDRKYIAAKFKCTDCYKGFSKEEMLKRHKQLRHSESLGPLECRFCHMRFKWDCYLRKHLRAHFTKYECLRCDLVCWLENSAMFHEDWHNGVIRKCIHCNEEFKHSSTYYTHLRTHRSEYVCTLCGASFVSPLGLTMHRKAKHVDNEVEIEDDDDVTTFCETCNIRFETRKAYDEHLFHSAMHTDIIEDDEIDDDIITPRKVLGKRLQAKITHDLKGFRSKADKMGDNEPAMPPGKKRRRKIRSTKRKPTTCHQCGKHFDTQAACMKHHLAEHPRTSFHPPTVRHICEICGASLAPGSVATHHNMHTREKVHPCEICGKSFHSSIGLKRHRVTHTGEKPFACTLCDKRFTQSNSMKLHYRTFHLKEPYPKRNRRKKNDDAPTDKSARAGDSSESESEDGIPAQRHLPMPHNMHYLTLG